ncbi:receptor-like protein 33 [Magnolia sinica]|uniref:receptor-like protein 33 n=1 Tax=Magnolia sinica TaxID=86752 RepID=UPI00265AD1A6|nr:receptor-like protein 33 [Magnolia sinica]
MPSFHGGKCPIFEGYQFSDSLHNGTIPSSLFSLPSLKILALVGNQFSDQLGEFQNASSSPLEMIYLDNNKLQGPIPRSIFQLPNLAYLTLSSNNFSGPIPSLFGNQLWNCQITNLVVSLASSRIASFSQLGRIELNNNSLQGTTRRSIFALTKLEYLKLSPNNFSGDVDLKYLWYLGLSNNHFSVSDCRSISTSISFPKIIRLKLRSCNISKFPDVLRSQEEMDHLDLSNDKINGKIPNWIWKVGNGTLYYLNLSHNALEGLVPPLLGLSISTLQYLDLSFNKLEGSIPIPALSIIFYSLSSKNFSGEVPLLFCNAQILVLILSDNHFNGSIPPCLGENKIGLTILNLGGNAFQGILPKTFKEQCTLETLDLSRNQLERQVPRSLANCKELEVLNLGNNQINNTFPFQLENFPWLRILILRSNKFDGTIGQFLATHTSPLLQIIDLSSNSFTGSLPSDMFKSWTAMMEEGKCQSRFLSKGSTDGYYQDKVTVVSKGQERELVKILIAFTIVDFSNNQIYVDIPKSIGDLKSLHGLNMSFNHLTGRIPASIGNIKDLESLDLSRNNLSGEIPLELTKLTFLEVLNLSQNQLDASSRTAKDCQSITGAIIFGSHLRSIEM